MAKEGGSTKKERWWWTGLFLPIIVGILVEIFTTVEVLPALWGWIKAVVSFFASPLSIPPWVVILLPIAGAGAIIGMIALARWRRAFAVLNPVAVKILRATNNVGGRQTSHLSPTSQESAVISILNEPYLARYVCDILEAMPENRMGVSTEMQDPEAFYMWSHNLIGMLRDLYSKHQSDAYAAWMRPTTENPRVLKVFQQHNMPEDYKPYEFHLEEGLAGKVWSTGEAAATSKLRQHPWWVYRDGCLSVSYICVPVGKPKGSGGVLAVGSFTGFEVVDSDLEVVKIFASLLSVVAAPIPPNH